MQKMSKWCIFKDLNPDNAQAALTHALLHHQCTFKCLNSIICVTFLSVCDTVMDCPYGDDEFFCASQPLQSLFTLCPQSCRCLSFLSCTSNRCSSSLILSILTILSIQIALYRTLWSNTIKCILRMWVQMFSLVMCSDNPFYHIASQGASIDAFLRYGTAFISKKIIRCIQHNIIKKVSIWCKHYVYQQPHLLFNSCQYTSVSKLNCNNID